MRFIYSTKSKVLLLLPLQIFNFPKPNNSIHSFFSSEFTRSLLINLTNGNSSIILINRFRNHCTLSDSNCFCGSDLPVGNEVLTLCKETRVHRLGHSLYLLLSSMCACSLIILLLFKLGFENKHSSKRDIYYMHPSVFLGE
ncbi:putative spo11/DNA topoisomerase VI subunit A [Medicago truncatula]|uniref:Putative spo11/DNA topoisomerase VI subunit A n=1 Tax=Medicago truncatula TaxID=3880 RepID=A0A396I1B1_MEDTR|nr:putative spo11/DNA topoisomerase VI subunit A [Medicago truncatula]